MLHFSILRPGIILLISLIACSLSAQSISGNVNSFSSAKNLGFANVNVYKDGKLVANVLADAEGNFKINLDTGTYKCEILYAGHEPVVKEILVRADEKSNFSMKKDKDSKYARYEAEEDAVVESEVAETEIFGMHSTETARADAPATYHKARRRALNPIPISYMWGIPDNSQNDSAQTGKLTAGEINDFSKWEMWTDLRKDELMKWQSYWYLAPTQRYSLQLTDQYGMPLANATAELLDGNSVIHIARTDNTGRTELWGKLEYDSLVNVTPSAIRVSYNGQTKSIQNIQDFSQGINSLVMETSCRQSINVDIALVVDATGSMQDEINYLKLDLNDVVYKSKQISNTLNLNFANIFYRDHKDDYLTSSQNFTPVLSNSVAFTTAHNADGGGDNPEAVEIALDSAINNLNWRENARSKILFLVLDAPPHNTMKIKNKMIQLARKAAEKGIRIVPVAGSGIDKGTEYLMRSLALATNGTYTFLTNHSGVGNPHISPSTDSYEVEYLNDLLVRIIKAYTYMPDCHQHIAELGINLPDSQVVITQKDTASLDTASAITPDPVKLQWKYYPNPTNGLVNIESNQLIGELYISDLSGKVLQVIRDIQPGIAVQADLSRYSSGIYLIRHAIGKKWYSGKIVLTRS